MNRRRTTFTAVVLAFLLAFTIVLGGSGVNAEDSEATSPNWTVAEAGGLAILLNTSTGESYALVEVADDRYVWRRITIERDADDKDLPQINELLIAALRAGIWSRTTEQSIDENGNVIGLRLVPGKFSDAGAGLKGGDVLTRINDVEVQKVLDVRSELSRIEREYNAAGTVVDVDIEFLRDGQNQNITFSSDKKRTPFGPTRKLTTDKLLEINWKVATSDGEEVGLQASGLKATDPKAIEEDDLLTKVDDVDITNTVSLRKAIRSAWEAKKESVTITLKRGDELIELEATLPQR